MRIKSLINASREWLQPRLKQKLANLSVRNRLILVTALWLSLIVSLTGTVIPLLMSYQLEQNAKSELNFTLEELTDLLRSNPTQDLNKITLSNSKLYEKKQDRFWLIEFDDRLYGSPSLAGKDLYDKSELPDHKLVIVHDKLYIEPHGKVKIWVALDDKDLDESLELLTGVLWFILSCLFFGVLILVAVQVRWSLKPINSMQNELLRLKSGNIEKLENRYPKELAPLAGSLNDLLFHYQDLLRRARNHTGNMAHALKTPLAALKNQIGQLPDQQKNDMQESVSRIERYIDYHLTRARVAGSNTILSVKSSPSQRVEAINIAFDKVYAEREILLINELDDDLEVKVDSADLDEMLGNLLENAYKWANSLIRVYAEQAGENQLKLIIEDDGKGIDEQEFQTVLKRGARLDEKVAGTGLGLNIVQEIAQSYQGSIELSHGQRGGLKVILILPC